MHIFCFRSVHSVINRTPPHLLREVLLVDDVSTLDELGPGLEEYFSDPKFGGKVKVLRQEKRQGLMRSRMAGIRASTAEILVFLDSHIEAGIGWLEPLLFRIQEDPKVSSDEIEFHHLKILYSYNRLQSLKNSMRELNV